MTLYAIILETPKWRIITNTLAWLFLAWKLYQTLVFYFFPGHKNLSRYKRKDRTYALVTGASGGIGYGYAQELLARGFNVILIANNKGKLAKSAETLRLDYSDARVETISIDAKAGNNEELEVALKNIVHLPVTVLINNVATLMLKPPYRKLSDYEAQDIDEMINANARFMAQVSRIMIPVLERSGPSLMLHMSATIHSGAPWLALYSATKSFNVGLATSIARESKAEGLNIDSIAIMTGPVSSDTNHFGNDNFTPTSRQYAKCVLDRVDMAVARTMTKMTPHWRHAIVHELYEKLPETVVQKIMANTLTKKLQVWQKLQ